MEEPKEEEMSIDETVIPAVGDIITFKLRGKKHSRKVVTKGTGGSWVRDPGKPKNPTAALKVTYDQILRVERV